MSDSRRQLTELVRLLQERGYIFAADPQPITDALQYAEGSVEDKLMRRAELVDSDHKLQDVLARVRNTFGWLLAAATVLWLLVGFSGTFGLMQQTGLNFFFVFAGVLGLHTLMLVFWLASLVLVRRKNPGFFLNPATWIRGRDPVNQAVLRLYNEEWNRPATRWRLGQTGHRLWLATLVGMLSAVVLLLLVRQYTFNWESTLLSDETSVQIVQLLAWLPAKLGFPVPDADAVLNSRLNSNAATARQWSGLLIGSIICYGLVPRFTAWLICRLLAKSPAAALPVDKPYYQNIIQQWQKRVVDADTQSETVAAIVPKIRLDGTPKWAVMLDAYWPDEYWYRHILGQEWLNKGTVDSRETVAALKNELQNHPVQLLIGVRARSVPDRGIMRQIAVLSEAASGGAVVQLLADGQSDGIEEYLAQWHGALQERGIAWLNPPKLSQQTRLAQEQETPLSGEMPV